MTGLEAYLKKCQRKTNNKDFLFEVLKNTKTLKEFMELVLKNPRENKPNYRILEKSFKDKKKWLKWQEEYAICYCNYMRELFTKAKKIEDVLKIIPNYSPWTLKDKFGSIHIGTIPKEFKDEKGYHDFLNKVCHCSVIQKYKQFKSLENNLPEFKKVFPEVNKIDWFDLSQRGPFLSDLMNKITGKIIQLKHLGHSYKLQFLCNPFSSKMVFKIKMDEKQEFILKMLAHQLGEIDSDYKRKESENQAIRSDSPYSNALMEFYLKLNKCPHAPSILYYTDKYEAVLYKLEKGRFLDKKEKLSFLDLNKKKLKDANRLGIYVNDISVGNFVEGKDGTYKIIDIGHASFANPLTQGVPGLTFTFGNLCGQDYLTHFGVMSLED